LETQQQTDESPKKEGNDIKADVFVLAIQDRKVDWIVSLPSKQLDGGGASDLPPVVGDQ
jgi:hypothetical protein